MTSDRLTTKDKYYFGGNREKAIQRDGEKCVGCGMSRSEHKRQQGRDLTVDHIEGHGVYDSLNDLPNNELSNLQTLCFSCHGKKSRPPKTPNEVERDLSTIVVCISCKQGKSYPTGFKRSRTYNGVIYRRKICNDCWKEYYNAWSRNNPKTKNKSKIKEK